MKTDEELIAEFIAERGVTRCPTATVLPTQRGAVSAEDVQLLRRIGDAAAEAWSRKRANRRQRQKLSARAKAGPPSMPAHAPTPAPVKSTPNRPAAFPRRARVFDLIEESLLEGGATVDSIARAVAEQTGRPLVKVTKTVKTQLSRMRQTRGLRITTERVDGRAVYSATKAV
jgi:hypothetical protein